MELFSLRNRWDDFWIKRWNSKSTLISARFDEWFYRQFDITSKLSIVAKINKDLPLHNLWDGFWIDYWQRKTLIIAASFDRIYYRQYEIIFKKVIFFNIPHQWRDTDMHGDIFVRLATRTEFKQHHPSFNTLDRYVFAIDIYPNYYIEEKYTFFIVAARIYLVECDDSDNTPRLEYTDPFENEDFPSLKNRVLNSSSLS